MESVTGPMNIDGHEKAVKPSKQIERASLGKTESDKLDSWIAQIKKSSKGFLSLTRSDVVNFLIRAHRDELLPKECLQVRAENYDPLKHIAWITPQIKLALTNGDSERVAELQEELRGVQLAAIQRPQEGSGAPSRQMKEQPVSKKRNVKNKTSHKTNQDEVSRSTNSAEIQNGKPHEQSASHLDFPRS